MIVHRWVSRMRGYPQVLALSPLVTVLAAGGGSDGGHVSSAGACGAAQPSAHQDQISS